MWDLTKLCQIQENPPSWFVLFCFYLIILSYFYLLRYFSLSVILQQRSNLRHCPPCMTFTVCFFHLKMVFSQDVCTLRWTYNKVIKPDRGNTFSLWPSPCQQIPFSAHFRAPWKNHYQSLTIELPFLNLAPLNVQMLFSLYCEILFTWAPIILFCCCWSLYWICYNTASILCFCFWFFFFFLTERHAGTYLPDQGSNPQPQHCKAKS